MRRATTVDGAVRCPYCSSTSITLRRTRRAKLFGLLALFTRPKIRCLACGHSSKRP